MILSLFLLWLGASPFPQFDARLKAYVELVDRVEKAVGKLPDRASAERVDEHRRSLAGAIAKARSGARQGDLFTSAERDAFVRLVRQGTGGRPGTPARKAIAEDNPKTAKNAPPVALAPNAPYPDGAPLSTVPPTLLRELPPLPKTVEYRFVGKALTLYDNRANVIVDYLPNALP